MDTTRPHRILLVNFTEKDSGVFVKAGFNVELGYIGQSKPGEALDYLPYFFPHPLFEYDVYIYNSVVPTKEMERLFPKPKDFRQDSKPFEPLRKFDNYPLLRISLIGGRSGFSNLVLGGCPDIDLRDAHEGLSDLVTIDEKRTFSLPDLEKTIRELKRKISYPIGQYLVRDERNGYPFYHLPVIVNRNGDEIASYGVLYSGKTVPVYVILPQLKDNVAGVLSILEDVSKLTPELFPDKKTSQWLGSSEFAFVEELAIDNEIEKQIENVTAFISSKRSEKEEIGKAMGFIRKILTATESPSQAEDQPLSIVVKRALEFLEFTVEDIDAKIRSAIRKEDFWVRDGEFLAITEVTGTRSKNPKTKEYNDLLGRMSTIFKRRDLVPDAKNISGLLIVNYDIDTHPFKRPRLYTGDAEEIVGAAIEQSIGLLSTVELYKILIAAKEGLITKDDARKYIKKYGRIEYVNKGDARKLQK
jgi:hypothetical protein